MLWCLSPTAVDDGHKLVFKSDDTDQNVEECGQSKQLV